MRGKNTAFVKIDNVDYGLSWNGRSHGTVSVENARSALSLAIVRAHKPETPTKTAKLESNASLSCTTASIENAPRTGHWHIGSGAEAETKVADRFRKRKQRPRKHPVFQDRANECSYIFDIIFVQRNDINSDLVECQT